MKSAAKLNHKGGGGGREREREREKQRLTSARDTSGWVSGWRRDTRLQESMSSEQAAKLFHSTPQTNTEQRDEMSGCQNID